MLFVPKNNVDKPRVSFIILPGMLSPIYHPMMNALSGYNIVLYSQLERKARSVYLFQLVTWTFGFAIRFL
jgi:hypothetical protein